MCWQFTRAKTARDGIGAIISVTPAGGRLQMTPVMGESNHASQESLNKIFGMKN